MTTGAPSTRLRVLLAEDELHLGALLEQFLAARGCEVTRVRDGRDALERLRTDDYDVALTDVQMPGLSGRELGHRIAVGFPDLPVLYMSGYTAASLGPQLNLDENSMLVEKPFTRSTLLGAIRTLCGPQPTRD